MNRYEEASDGARELLSNFDEIDLAEMLASSQRDLIDLKAELAAVRALLAAPGNSWRILPGDLRAALDGAEAGQ